MLICQRKMTFATLMHYKLDNRFMQLVYLETPCIFCWKTIYLDNKMNPVVQLNRLPCKRTINWWSLLMSGVNSVSRYEEASAGGGSFAPQGGLISWQNLVIHVSRTSWRAITNNLSSSWCYQYSRWSLINKSVVLLNQIYGST